MSVRKRYVRQETVESRMSNAVAKRNSINTEALLAEGVDPNLRYDRSPILFSATLPNLRVLHAHGANLDIQNDDGYTLLNYLCHIHRTIPVGMNHTERIRFLLANGVESNVPDSTNGDTPLHSVCRGSIDPIIIRLLLQYGADPNIQNNNGETPLHCLAGNISIFIGRPIRPYRESVEALLAGGATPTIRDESNHLPSEHARAVFTEPARRLIGHPEQELITYLEHIEQGVPPPPPPPPAPAARAALAVAAPPLDLQNLFNNMPNHNIHNGNPANHPRKDIAAPPQNNANREPAEANENRVGGGRHRRRVRTVKHNKGKSKGKGRRQGKTRRRH